MPFGRALGRMLGGARRGIPSNLGGYGRATRIPAGNRRTGLAGARMRARPSSIPMGAGANTVTGPNSVAALRPSVGGRGLRGRWENMTPRQRKLLAGGGAAAAGIYGLSQRTGPAADRRRSGTGIPRGIYGY